MPPRTPYQDTSVPVERSKETIRSKLRDAGALGVQIDEEWGDEPRCRVRFLWPVVDGERIGRLVVRLEVKPLPPEPGARSAWRVSPEQRERQAWRSLAHYLEHTLNAAHFGLIRFEDVFLSFIEDGTGRTVGDVMVPHLHGQALLELESGARQ
jgi:hypothetical protein